MIGYKLEFKRNYCPEDSKQPYTMTQIGQVYADQVVDSVNAVRSEDDLPNGSLELVAAQLPHPRRNENFLQPVNETTNRRCQEWTTDYVKRLVSAGYIIGEDAINIVQAQSDPPSHGIGLQAIARG